MSDDPGRGAPDGPPASISPLAGSRGGGGWIGGLSGVAIGVTIVALCWSLGQREEFGAAIIIWFSGFVLALVLGLFGKWYLVGGGVAIGLLSGVVLVAVACFAAFRTDYLGVDKLAEGKLAPQGAELLSTEKRGTDFLSTEARINRTYAYDAPAEDVIAFFRAELGSRGWEAKGEGRTGASWAKGEMVLNVRLIKATTVERVGFEVVVSRSESQR